MGIYRCSTENSSYCKRSIPVSTHSVVIHDAKEKRWLHFREPQQVIESCSIEKLIPMLTMIESLVNERGLYAAGFKRQRIKNSRWVNIEHLPIFLQSCPFHD